MSEMCFWDFDYNRNDDDCECEERRAEPADEEQHNLQQLKAEIAAKKKPERPYPSDYEEGCIDGYNDAIDDVLRQLSAV